MTTYIGGSMVLKARSRIERGQFKSQTGELRDIPFPFVDALKKLVRAYSYCIENEVANPVFGLGKSFDFLFLRERINVGESSNVEQIKNRLTYNEKLIIEDLRKRDQLRSSAIEKNNLGAKITSQSIWFSQNIGLLEGLKKGSPEYIFRLSGLHSLDLENQGTSPVYPGITTIYDDFLFSDYWKNVKLAILTRDDWHCQHCGATFRLQVHHKTYENHLDEQNYLEDLVLLCEKCHGKEHSVKMLNRTIPKRFAVNTLNPYTAMV